MSSQKAIILALDAMGGDHAPLSIIEGADRALRKLPDHNLEFIFYGNSKKITDHLNKKEKLLAKSKVVHTEDFISDDERPSVALRQGKTSSMRMAIDAVAKKEAHGVISSGNTGALMAMSKIVLRMLPGIDRPAIISTIPTIHGRVVLLDLGANVDCTAEHLFQFAVMGDAFARAELGLDNPRIALLNIGAEELKGNESVREAADMLRATDLPLNYQGFIEGNGIAFSEADVIVTDGFTGNIALKTLEGTARFCQYHFKAALMGSVFSKIGAYLARKELNRLKKKLDPRRYNGAMFAGLNGIAVKSHGSADHKAFSKAIKVAVAAIDKDINGLISSEMAHYHEQIEKAE